MKDLQAPENMICILNTIQFYELFSALFNVHEKADISTKQGLVGPIKGEKIR